MIGTIRRKNNVRGVDYGGLFPCKEPEYMCVHKIQGCVEEAEISLKFEENAGIDLLNLESDRKSKKISAF